MSTDPNMIITPDTPNVWHPNVTVLAPEKELAEALYMSSTRKVAEVDGDAQHVEVGVVSDTQAVHVAEGDAIEPTQPDLGSVSINTTQLAVLVNLSRSQFRQHGANERIAESVRRSLIRAADRALVNAAPQVVAGQGPSTGVANLTGVNRVVVSDSLDPLIDAVALAQAAGGNPDAIICAPDTYAYLRKLKTDSTTSRQHLLGAGVNAGEARILSLPVIVNSQLEPGQGLVWSSEDVYSAWSSLEVGWDESAQWNRVGVSVRGLIRAGHTVADLGRLGVFTLDGVTRTWTLDLGGATDGTFTLAHGGNVTSGLAHNINASDLKAALVAFDDGFKADAWTVTGSAGAFEITAPAGALTGNGASLTGGTGLVLS